MASFLEELWKSVFEEGTSPTLLLATNVTFGALLFVLLCLLIATWSIHFLILSILSIGLWGGINWFAREISLAQAQEESQLKKDSKPSKSQLERSTDLSADAMDSGDDTETELDESQRHRESTPQVSTPTSRSTAEGADVRSSSSSMLGGGENTALSSSRSTATPDRELKKRQRQAMMESTGSLSTDSEWEKVDDER